MLKTILTGIFWGILIMLALPTTLILASWNAIPGDSTYQLKTGLEKVILGVVPSDNLKTALEIKYTERRFSEVEKVLATDTQYVNESLNNFNNQMIASKDSLQKIQNSEEKETQKQNLIATLEVISQKIDEKQQISSVNYTAPTATTKPKTNISPTPTNPPTNQNPTIAPVKNIPTNIPPTNNPPTNTPIPTNTPQPTPTTAPSQPPPSPGDLEDTKKKIKEIIDELKDTESNQQQNHNQNNQSNNHQDNRENQNKQNDHRNNSKD